MRSLANSALLSSFYAGKLRRKWALPLAVCVRACVRVSLSTLSLCGRLSYVRVLFDANKIAIFIIALPLSLSFSHSYIYIYICPIVKRRPIACCDGHRQQPPRSERATFCLSLALLYSLSFALQ